MAKLPSQQSNRRHLACWVWALGCVLGLFVQVPNAHGQGAVLEGFETPEASWRDAGGDAQYRLQIKRIQGFGHTGDGCEQIAVEAGNGSYIYVQHPVSSARVIEELRPAVWVRSNRTGVQFLARVVLPFTVDPATNEPATTLLHGTLYNDVGRWQQLRLENPLRALEQQRPMLQSRLGRKTHIDLRLAYVDQVLLNVYGGAGKTELLTDDLEMHGFVARNASDERETGGSADNDMLPSPRPAVQANGSVLLVDDRPTLIRMVRYQGEPLELIARLGFNTIFCPLPPPAHVFREASDLGLWLVCPPPEPLPSDGFDSRWDPVLLWYLGGRLTTNDVERVRTLSRAVRQADRRLVRPRLVSSNQAWRSLSRSAEVLLAERSPIATSLEFSDYTSWLEHQTLCARAGTPFWATIATQPPTALTEQWQVLGMPAAAQATANIEQLRLASWTAISAGARGLYFDSNSPLNRTDPATRQRAQALELLNLELELIAPWVAGGRAATTLTTSDANVQATALSGGRARILLPRWCGPGSQWVPAQAAVQELTLVVPAQPESTDAFELSPAGLRPLPKLRVTGGIRLTLQEFSVTNCILLTQDPTVLRTCRERLASIQRRAASLSRELAQQRLAETLALVDQVRLPDRTRAPIGQWLTVARAQFEECDRLIAQNEHANGYLVAQRVLRPLRMIAREAWDRLQAEVSTPSASPLLLHVSTLPAQFGWWSHWQQASVRANALSSGDCEDLQALIRDGWRQDQVADETLKTAVWLSDEGPHSGRHALRMLVRPVDERSATAWFEAPPVWATTGAIQAKGGSVLRISGWCRVPQAVQGSVDRLLVFDSVAGPELGLRLGPTNGWQRFEWMRAMPRTGPIHLTLALTGYGEAWLDDLQIEVLPPRRDELPTGASQPNLPGPEGMDELPALGPADDVLPVPGGLPPPGGLPQPGGRPLPEEMPLPTEGPTLPGAARLPPRNPFR